jgi:hypothetical protein
MLRVILALFLCALGGTAQTRAIALAEYRDRVHGAWLGQIAGAVFGWPFEGKAHCHHRAGRVT